MWGKRIVVTRSRAQASVLVQKIRELGGTPLEFPTIEIQKAVNLNPLKKALKEIKQYDWIIFTSVNAIDIFFGQMDLDQIDIRELKGVNIAAIGPVTRQKLEARGLRVEAMPEEYRAEGVLDTLNGLALKGQRVLLPRAKGARSILPDTLVEWGLEVDEIHLYQAALSSGKNPFLADVIKSGEIDYITFTSSSTVSNFVEIMGRDIAGLINSWAKIACIGPITADKAREMGFSVDIVAGQYTIDGLLDAIIIDASGQQQEESL